MAPPEILRLSFPDQGALEREIAANLRYGRVFVGHVIDLPVLSEGMLVIVHPVHGRELHLLAQIVMVNTDGPMRGTGLALRSFGPDEAERVLAFVHDKTSDPAQPLSLAPEPRVRISTPPPTPRTSAPPQAAPRTSALPEARRVTVPPVSPENDWSDLPTTGLTRHPALQAQSAASEAPAPPASSAPSASDAPFAVIVPAGAVTVVPPAEAPATVQPPAAAASDDDDWSDVARAVNGEPEPQNTASDASGETPDESGYTAADEADPGALDSEEAPEYEGAADDHDTGDDSGADGEAQFDEDPSAIDAPAATDLQQSNRQERLRSLNVVEQLKIARRGELSDRVVVERLYGKQVWEALLQNPRLTLPEVARIARKGTVPRPLIEQIVGNASWTKAPNVRRALLSNPKLTQEGVLKLLALTPKHELKILEKATAYPMAVRDAARKILREG